MSSHDALVMVPRAVAVPRGAEWAADPAARTIKAWRAWFGPEHKARQFGTAVLRALERVGERRASFELERLARYYDPFDPAMARLLREPLRNDAATA